jgi:hypothetical protein
MTGWAAEWIELYRVFWWLYYFHLDDRSFIEALLYLGDDPYFDTRSPSDSNTVAENEEELPFSDPPEANPAAPCFPPKGDSQGFPQLGTNNAFPIRVLINLSVGQGRPEAA